MDNIAAYKLGYRDGQRVVKVAQKWESYIRDDLTAVEVINRRPSLHNFTEAYRNGWTDAVTGDDWRIKYLASA